MGKNEELLQAQYPVSRDIGNLLYLSAQKAALTLLGRLESSKVLSMLSEDQDTVNDVLLTVTSIITEEQCKAIRVVSAIHKTT